MIRHTPLLLGPYLLVAVCVWARPAKAQSPGPATAESNLVAIEGATLWDGTGTETVPQASVVIDGDRIACAGTLQLCPVPPGARVINAAGRWLLPGLIDTHVHLLFRDQRGGGRDIEADLRDLLARGITAVRDMGTDPHSLLELTRAVPSPRVYPMQLVAGPRFFYGREAVHNSDGSVSAYRLPPAQVMQMLGWTPILYQRGDRADSVVSQARAAGAIGLKLYADLTAAQVKELVQAAHQAGLPVWGHAWVQPASVLEQAQAGQDGVVHAAGLAGELYSAAVRDTLRGATALFEATAAVANRSSAHDPRILAALDTLASRGTFLEPTLDATVRRLTHYEATHPRHAAESEAYVKAAAEFGVEVTREAVRRRVRITAGTDHVAYGPPEERASLSDELALLVDSIGLTPVAALRAATADAAVAIGGEAAERLGIIAPGRWADLVLLRGNPLADIRAVAKVEWVMQGGRLLRPDQLRREASP
jgi:imidazolonepropionase-like amidohydrolase